MLTVVIQAGGGSTRMGRDKGLLPFLGQPLVARIVERLADLADEILVTTNLPDGYRFLNLPLVADLLPGRGALGGLYTALSAASYPYVAVVACDMPFVSRALLAAGRYLLAQTAFDAVVPRTPGGLEPFHAVYRRVTCLPLVKEVLEAGKQRVDAWYSQAQIHYLEADEIARNDPAGLAFYNVNTLEELRAAEKMARGKPAENN